MSIDLERQMDLLKNTKFISRYIMSKQQMSYRQLPEKRS